MDAWADSRAVQLAFITSGKPTEYAIIEGFNGIRRDKCLNTELPHTMPEVRGKLAAWRFDYNQNEVMH